MASVSDALRRKVFSKATQRLEGGSDFKAFQLYSPTHVASVMY